MVGLEQSDTEGSGFDRESEEERLQKRLAEYRRKYSVYSNVVVLDGNGRVAVAENRVGATHIKDAVAENCTADGFSEYYGTVDFSDRKELVYCQKITDTGKSDGKMIGTLCLVFDFENEMRDIFGNLDF